MADVERHMDVLERVEKWGAELLLRPEDHSTKVICKIQIRNQGQKP